MAFQIIRNDITKVRAEAIVNTANPDPVIGSGTDAAIYKAAGKKKLLEERKKIGAIRPGQTAYTPAFDLNAKYILHTVGPGWIDGSHGEREILHSCYEKSLELAKELGCKSIAFPLMATGSYGFPKDEALRIALDEINRFLLHNEMRVILVVFDRKSFELSSNLVGEIEAYIDENEVKEIRLKERAPGYRTERRRQHINNAMLFQGRANALEAARPADTEDSMTFEKAYCASEMSLDEMLGQREDTFQQRLFKLIDESGLDDVTVYKKANIDRKVFSKIRCNEDYKPKKKTAVAFAIALELDLASMEDLLSRAEIALSPSSKFDLIITYFVKKQNYDIFEINATLFQYNQPILGE